MLYFLFGQFLNQCFSQDTYGVSSGTACSVKYLVSATCAICCQNRGGIGPAYCRKKALLPNLHTHLVMFLFIAKRSGHTATPGSNKSGFIILGKIEYIKCAGRIG